MPVGHHTLDSLCFVEMLVLFCYPSLFWAIAHAQIQILSEFNDYLWICSHCWLLSVVPLCITFIARANTFKRLKICPMNYFNSFFTFLISQARMTHFVLPLSFDPLVLYQWICSIFHCLIETASALWTLQLYCTDTTTLKWTRHVDTWQILKNTHDTCVRHACLTSFGHDTALW